MPAEPDIVAAENRRLLRDVNHCGLLFKENDVILRRAASPDDR